MRQETADTREHREAILALLEERPYSTTELRELLEMPSGTRQMLDGMRKRGELVWRREDDTWSLPDSADVPAPPMTRTHQEQSKERDAEVSRTSQLLGDGKRIYPAPTPKASKDGGTSWWVGLSREDLNSQARHHQPRMHASKFARIQPGFVE